MATNPWDITQAFAEQLMKQGAATEQGVREAQMMPIQQGMAMERLKNQRELLLSTLGRELSIRDAAGIPGENRAFGRQRALLGMQFGQQRSMLGAGTDEALRRYRGTTAINKELGPDYWNMTHPRAVPRVSDYAKTHNLPPDPAWEGSAAIPKDLGPDALKEQYPPGTEFSPPESVGQNNFMRFRTPDWKTKKSTTTVPNPVQQVPKLENNSNTPAAPKGDSKAEFNPSEGKTIIDSAYNAYRAAGYSDKGAKAILAEMGRENSFDMDLIFGEHSDPHNKAKNIGALSWQGDRRQKIARRLQERGLLDETGRPIRNQETMNEFARFTADEMGYMSPQTLAYLKSENVNPEIAARLLGQGYIKWRFNDPAYAGHHENRRNWLNTVNQKIKPQAMATEDPDIFDVLIG